MTSVAPITNHLDMRPYPFEDIDVRGENLINVFLRMWDGKVRRSRICKTSGGSVGCDGNYFSPLDRSVAHLQVSSTLWFVVISRHLISLPIADLVLLD
jgi:hypothetical protein